MRLGQADRALAIEAAERFDAALDIRAGGAAWQPHRFLPRDEALPVVHLEDVSGIPFLTGIAGVERYQLRARVRATDGDLVACTFRAPDDYERYCRDRLMLGAPRYVHAEPTGFAIEVARACRRGAALAALVDTARASGGLVLHPYMGIDEVWGLAQDVAAASGARVSVLAPPPAVTAFANDKRHLTSLASELLGPGGVVRTRLGSDATTLGAALLALAADRPRVGLKMARCASAMGNRVFDSAVLLGMPREAVVALVARFLTDKEWELGEELLAVAWEDTDISPSAQLWIPPAGSGEPVLDGVYEQLLEGPEKVFLGSVPSRLGRELDARVGRAALLLGTAYQALGYVGRCSFDFIVVGDALLATECNGRWGGTSTPMRLMDRLFPGGRPPYRARDFVAPGLTDAPFARLADALGDDLYDSRTGRGRYVLYNVGCLRGYGKFDVIAIGSSVDEANTALESELPVVLARFGCAAGREDEA